jgi:hypothetical protein
LAYAQPVSVYVRSWTSQKFVSGVQGGESTQLGCGGAGPKEHSIPPSHVPIGVLPSGQVVPVGAQTGASTSTSTHGTRQYCVAVQVDVPHANGPSAGGGAVGESMRASLPES